MAKQGFGGQRLTILRVMQFKKIVRSGRGNVCSGGDRGGRAKSRFPIIGWGLLSKYTNWAFGESGTWSLWLFLILTPILIYILCLFFLW